MTLVLYLFKKFIPLFIGALAFFALVLGLVDLLMNLWSYISNQVPMGTVAKIELLYLPKTVWYATPLAVLFAVSYSLSDFYANNELVAVFASGVPLINFTLPLLIFSFLMSIGLFFFEDALVVPTYAQKTELQTSVLNKEKSLNNDKIVVLGEGGRLIYKADFYDDDAQRLFALYLVVRNEDKSLKAVIRADSALWREDRWVLSGATQYTVKDEGMVIQPPSRDITALLTEPPETFRNNTISVETVSASEAREYIEHLQRTGLPSGEARSEYYKKFAFPFILFIVVFLSVGLSGKTRKNVLLTSLASCISAAVLFYVSQMITMLLAKFEYISPFMGAWFPVFLFVAISIVLLRFART
ncbi:MAG: LptF/LptG family permease [Treponema sp.]|nr:LptF/LptG family permease [Treponema sp.]